MPPVREEAEEREQLMERGETEEEVAVDWLMDGSADEVKK